MNMEKLQSFVGDQSDSDSGESWILLDNNNSESEPDFPENPHREEENLNIEKDDDTDGISIISESDPEPCELVDNVETESNHYKLQSLNQNCEATELQENQDANEVYEDLVGDSTGIMKTYVHRRNKKLSKMLNFFVLISVIMAAGVAIGHMWGVRDDCVQQSSSSVNKILSNLYKLQEENAFLKYKIKELALLTGIQNFKRKGDFDKVFPLQQRCRKVFEDALSNKNVKSTKCVDPEFWNDDIEQTTFDKDNLIDLDKIRLLYKQNKSRLENEGFKALIEDELALEKKRNTIEANKWLAKMILKYDKQVPNRKVDKEDFKVQNLKNNGLNNKNTNINVKLLKSEPEPSYHHLLSETNTDKIGDNYKIRIKRQKKKKSKIVMVNTDEKYRTDKLKNTNNKKNKKENSKDQPKLKGEYGYNDLYSSHNEKYDSIYDNNEPQLKVAKNEKKSKETGDDCPILDIKYDMKKSNNDKKAGNDGWYEKRAKFRMESRKRVIGEYNLDNADWYFRRMYKREQNRAKPDNSTYKKAQRKN